MRTVRTTSQPDKLIEVTDAEYLDLKRWGVLIEDEPSRVPMKKPEGTK
ncbi:hypothetical protein ACWEAF_05700 [Streptomyces sp. NPDC005071]